MESEVRYRRVGASFMTSKCRRGKHELAVNCGKISLTENAVKTSAPFDPVEFDCSKIARACGISGLYAVCTRVGDGFVGNNRLMIIMGGFVL